jgi:RNA polymerase sigma-B factor
MARTAAKFKLTAEQQDLVLKNLNLARREAWRYQRRTEIDYKILESVAFEGLCQAASRYDPTMINDKTGTAMKFSSIAVPYTRGAILHYIRDKTYILKLSHKMRENWLKGRKLMYQNKSDQYIADALGLELMDWLETRVTCSGPPLELKEQGAPTIDIEADEADFSLTYLECADHLLQKVSEETRQKIGNYFITTNSKNIDAIIKTLFKNTDVDCLSLDRPSGMWYTDVV